MRHIICFGNELHGDDGFGVAVFNQLVQYSWPQDIQIFNAGITGLNALNLLATCQQAILVDALINFGQVGTVYQLRPDELAANHHPELSSHGLGLPYLLAALKTIREPMPDIVIIGVEIASVQLFWQGLTDQTTLAVEKTVQLIRGMLSE